jgi:hypothetical protein
MARPQTTVLEALARRLDDDPDGPYLDFEGVTYTAREMDREPIALHTAWPRCMSATATGSRRC